MKKTMTIAIVTALTTAPMLAFAQPGSGPGRGLAKHFEKLDTDHNGSVSLDELTSSIRSRLARFDADSDGNVTRDEVSAFQSERIEQREAKRIERDRARVAKMQQMFEKRDADNDGRLSAEELGKRGGKRFAKLDSDGDGFVTPEELAATRQRHSDRIAAKRDKLRARSGKRMGKRFERVDSDKDGVIEPSEVDTHAKARFDALDADKSGQLEKAELSKRGKKARKERAKSGKRSAGKASKTNKASKASKSKHNLNG